MHDVALSFLAYDMATVLLQIFYRKIDRRSTNANSIPRTQHADDGWRRRAGEINLSIPDRSRSTEMARDINLVISRWRTTLTAIICARSSAVARPKSISPPPPPPRRRRRRKRQRTTTPLLTTAVPMCHHPQLFVLSTLKAPCIHASTMMSHLYDEPAELLSRSATFGRSAPVSNSIFSSQSSMAGCNFMLVLPSVL